MAICISDKEGVDFSLIREKAKPVRVAKRAFVSVATDQPLDDSSKSNRGNDGGGGGNFMKTNDPFNTQTKSTYFTKDDYNYNSLALLVS